MGSDPAAQRAQFRIEGALARGLTPWHVETRPIRR